MLPEDIQKQYDISRKRAIDEAEKRKEMAYRAWPRLKEIDGEIRDISFKLGIELVNAKDRDAVRHRTAEKLELLRIFEYGAVEPVKASVFTYS